MSETARDTAPPPAGGEARAEKHVVIRYGLMGYLAILRHDLENPPRVGSHLVVRTERGTELGKVLLNVGIEPAPGFITPEALERYCNANGPDYVISREGRVLRVANPQDVNDQNHLDRSAHEKVLFCREHIRRLNLPMWLVALEHLLGGERIVFYFTSENRIDFRELVRCLATEYHTRIEMRQVGARDEARLVGDYERCGQHCCCQEYLKFLKPVSMRMAKVQKATLDPTKISGRCGRLMCCLRYEDGTYDELSGKLPRRNTWVRTSDGAVGKVIEAHILTQIVKLMLPDYSIVAVPNEAIVERGVPESPPAPPGKAVARPRSAYGLRPVVVRPAVRPPPEAEDPADADVPLVLPESPEPGEPLRPKLDGPLLTGPEEEDDSLPPVASPLAPADRDEPQAESPGAEAGEAASADADEPETPGVAPPSLAGPGEHARDDDQEADDLTGGQTEPAGDADTSGQRGPAQRPPGQGDGRQGAPGGQADGNRQGRQRRRGRRRRRHPESLSAGTNIAQRQPRPENRPPRRPGNRNNGRNAGGQGGPPGNQGGSGGGGQGGPPGGKPGPSGGPPPAGPARPPPT